MVLLVSSAILGACIGSGLFAVVAFACPVIRVALSFALFWLRRLWRWRGRGRKLPEIIMIQMENYEF